MTDKLQFRRATGEQAEAVVRADDAEFPAGQFLTARRVWLDDGTELRQHRVAKGSRRNSGYDRLDNEILAGRQLYEVAQWSGSRPEVTRLYGDEAMSADPYILLEPYRGKPLSEVGRQLLEDEQEAFEVSLLTGLCWLAAAGIAHRGLSPDTVLWDSQLRQVQITDFSLSTVFGAHREAIMGSPGWAALEQRPGKASGEVSDRDDIWAAGRLIFFVRNHVEEVTDRRQLADSGLSELLDGVFGPPEARPTARDLLVGRMGRPSPVPRWAHGSERLTEGRRRFWAARGRKHPGATIPPEAGEDITDPGLPAPPATGNGNHSASAAAAAPGPLPVTVRTVAAPDSTGQRAAQRKQSRWRRSGR